MRVLIYFVVFQRVFSFEFSFHMLFRVFLIKEKF